MYFPCSHARVIPVPMPVVAMKETPKNDERKQDSSADMMLLGRYAATSVADRKQDYEEIECCQK